MFRFHLDELQVECDTVTELLSVVNGEVANRGSKERNTPPQPRDQLRASNPAMLQSMISRAIKGGGQVPVMLAAGAFVEQLVRKGKESSAVLAKNIGRKPTGLGPIFHELNKVCKKHKLKPQDLMYKEIVDGKRYWFATDKTTDLLDRMLVDLQPS